VGFLEIDLGSEEVRERDEYVDLDRTERDYSHG